MDFGANAVLPAQSYQRASVLNASINYQQIQGKGFSYEQLSISAQYTDIVSIGQNSLSDSDSIRVVLEQALEKLRSVVGEAREALGIPEGAVIDTSPEATAGRIADFALGFFDQFRANNPELSDDEAKSAFVELIGGAIQQGIDEARDILSALNALNGETDDKISTIEQLIQQRLDEFIGGGDSE